MFQPKFFFDCKLFGTEHFFYVQKLVSFVFCCTSPNFSVIPTSPNLKILTNQRCSIRCLKIEMNVVFKAGVKVLFGGNVS